MSNYRTVKTVEKALQVLSAFTSDEPELGVTEIGNRLGLHKSNVSRILATLAQGQLVERVPDSGRFRLGLGILLLASRTYSHMDLRQAASDVVHSLADTYKETVALAILHDDRVVALDVAHGPYSVRSVSWIGRHLCLHCTSAGKLLLAFAPKEQIERVLAAPLPRFTQNTITCPEELCSHLEEIRRTGVAFVLEELEPDLNALSVPVFNGRGEVVAALSPSGPASRLGLEQLQAFVEPTKEAALRISARLGFLTGA